MIYEYDLVHGGKFLFSNKIFPEFERILEKAKLEKHPEPLGRLNYVSWYCIGKDSYGNYLSWQMFDNDTEQKYGDGVFEIGAIYCEPEVRNAPGNNLVEYLNIWRDAVDHMYSTEIGAKLLFISRTYVKASWDLFLRKGIRFELDDNYWLTTRPTHLQRSWKKIKYRGDLNLLTVPKMDEKKYKNRFGKYFFWNDLIPEISKMKDNPGHCLIVGDRDNQATVRLLDKFSHYNSFSIEQLKTYQEDWDCSKPYFNQVISKIKSHNINNCDVKDKLQYISELGNKKYNFIFVDIKYKELYNNLAQDGVIVEYRS